MNSDILISFHITSTDGAPFTQALPSTDKFPQHADNYTEVKIVTKIDHQPKLYEGVSTLSVVPTMAEEEGKRFDQSSQLEINSSIVNTRSYSFFRGSWPSCESVTRF